MSEGLPPPPQILEDQKAPPGSGAAAARRITTCPPRFLDFATCLHMIQYESGITIFKRKTSYQKYIR